MKKAGFILLVLGVFFTKFTFADEAYLQRFMNYWHWRDNLPNPPNPNFLEFIQKNGPLSTKLRDKWLYQLAQQKDWQTFNTYYKPSQDLSLQCDAEIAAYNMGQKTSALMHAKTLWLCAQSMPKACNTLFDLLQHSDLFTEDLITQRLEMALKARNVGLTRYLLKQYQEPKTEEIETLDAIIRNPHAINQLTPSPLHELFYYYGLNRLVSMNMNQAIFYWYNIKTKQMLSEEYQQDIAARIALYKALRNQNDAYTWFKKVKPKYYNNVLLDWALRYSLKHKHWKQVKHLIQSNPEKASIDNQYWYARALEALGEKENAKSIYSQIAKERNYYGFLASKRLGQKPQFAEEPVITDLGLLKSYQPILDLIQTLRKEKQWNTASILINDFSIELPENEKSAFVYWIANTLKWHGKAVYLSTNKQLHNQLQLRFPTAYKEVVQKHASKAKIPSPLVFAMIRQESAFREDAVSSAGAKGLMQLMPETAYRTAKAAKIPYHGAAELFEPTTNIPLGIAYLKTLANEYDNEYILMIAAYNAGPRQVRYWLKHHPKGATDIWIESLPWRETRNYLKNVISFYVVYQHRLGDKVDIDSIIGE